MAPLPKRKHSQRKGRIRRVAMRLSISHLTACPSCKKPIRPHTICPYCGFYKGKAFIVKRDLPAGRQEKVRKGEKEHENTQ